ncbi:MAG: FG-GAP-like repeat-containing protein [Blastocatellia bacterium]|nr:FG-GAP-like repeat-containing protein [Blastocatellia bacterium]
MSWQTVRCLFPRIVALASLALLIGGAWFVRSARPVQSREDVAPAALDLQQGPDLALVGMRASDGITVNAVGQISGNINAIAADVNGDGMNDLLIGVPYNDGPDGARSNCGAVYIILGRPGQRLPLIRDLNAERPNVIIYGADPGDQLGYSLAAGDVNGDGVADVIIGAPFADGPNNARSNVGEVYVLFGGSSIAATSVRDLRSSSADVTIIGWGGPAGKNVQDEAGASVAVGDVNGDRIADIIIGAPGVKGPDGNRTTSPALGLPVSAGAIYVLFGSSRWTSPRDIGSNPAQPSADVVIYGRTSTVAQIYRVGEGLGQAVAVGDVNGDGIGDIIGGAPFYTAGNDVSQGRAYVFLGSRSPRNLRDTSRTGTDPQAPNATINGIDAADFLGSIVATGDVSGDGIDDLVIGVPQGSGPGNARPGSGEVYVLFGGSSLTGSRDLDRNPPDARFYGADPGDALGFSIAVGDWNGDGQRDLILAAPAADGPGNRRDGAGEIYIILGGASFLRGTVDFAETPPDPNLTIYGATIGDQVGFSLAAADLDRDGKADVIATSPFGDGPPEIRRPKAGVVYAIRGR